MLFGLYNSPYLPLAIIFLAIGIFVTVLTVTMWNNANGYLPNGTDLGNGYHVGDTYIDENGEKRTLTDTGIWLNDKELAEYLNKYTSPHLTDKGVCTNLSDDNQANKDYNFHKKLHKEYGDSEYVFLSMIKDLPRDLGLKLCINAYAEGTLK